MPQEQQRQPKNDYSELREDFSDVFETHINPFSAVITFGRRATKPEDDHHYTVRMRMPLQQAKTLTLMLLRSIRQYERQFKVEVDLPQEMLTDFGIAPDDWRRFSIDDDGGNDES